MIDTILIVAENVAVVVIVVIHEQVAGVSVVVEVIGEMPHLLFEVIAVVYDFSGEIFLAVVLSDVAVLEMFEFFAVPVDEGVHSVRRILVAHVAANQRDGSFGLLWANPDVYVLSFESFFVSLHCWNGFGG